MIRAALIVNAGVCTAGTVIAAAQGRMTLAVLCALGFWASTVLIGVAPGPRP